MTDEFSLGTSMGDWFSILAMIFIAAGIFFIFIGSVGILRLPDFFSRSHAVSKSDTLGIMCVIAGLMILEGLTLNSLKLLLVILFVFLANPIGTHALARAAMAKGIRPVLGAAPWVVQNVSTESDLSGHSDPSSSKGSPSSEIQSSALDNSSSKVDPPSKGDSSLTDAESGEIQPGSASRGSNKPQGEGR